MPHRFNKRKTPHRPQSGVNQLSTRQLYQLLGLARPDDEEVREVDIILKEIHDNPGGSTGLFIPKQK